MNWSCGLLCRRVDEILTHLKVLNVPTPTHKQEMECCNYLMCCRCNRHMITFFFRVLEEKKCIRYDLFHNLNQQSKNIKTCLSVYSQSTSGWCWRSHSGTCYKMVTIVMRFALMKHSLLPLCSSNANKYAKHALRLTSNHRRRQCSLDVMI